jgi:hypothetical protein
MGVGLFVANRLSERSDSPIQGSPGDVGLEYEDVGFKSENGVPLRAWWTEKGDAERVAILVHGFGGNRSDEHILQTAPIFAATVTPAVNGVPSATRKYRTCVPPSLGCKIAATNQKMFCCTVGRWAARPSCGPPRVRT